LAALGLQSYEQNTHSVAMAHRVVNDSGALMTVIPANDALRPRLPAVLLLLGTGASLSIAAAAALLNRPLLAPLMSRFAPVQWPMPVSLPALRFSPPAALDWEVLGIFLPVSALILGITALVVLEVRLQGLPAGSLGQTRQIPRRR
jgi:hypothetical protein